MLHNIYNLQSDMAGYYGEFYITFNKMGYTTIWYRDNIVSDAVYNSLSATNKAIYDRLTRNYVYSYLDSPLKEFNGKKFMDKIGTF